MSQTNPKYSQFDSASKREPRGSATIPNIPPSVNEVDHSQEVRTLVNELQAAAREARARTTSVELERDDLAARLAEAKSQLAEVRQQFVEISSLLRERDAAVQRAERSLEQLQELQRQIDGLARERSEAVKGRDENARLARESSRQLDETQKQLIAIRGARDSAQTMNLELNDKVRALREDLTFAQDERDIAEDRTKKAQGACDELRRQLEEAKAALKNAGGSQETADRVSAELAAARKREEELEARQGEMNSQIQALTSELEGFRSGNTNWEGKLGEANAEISRLKSERHEQEQNGADHVASFEAQVAALHEQLAQRDKRLAEAAKRAETLQSERDAVVEKAGQAESQRLCAIDLAAQLENAKRDLIALAADLAEARLQNKSNQSRLVRAALSSASGAPAVAAEPVIDPAVDILSEKEARSTLGAIKQCLTSFTKTPTDLSLLNELHCHVHHLSERARVSSYIALHRIAHALSLFAQELYRYPEQVNSSTTRTLTQTIDFLGVLLKQRDYAAIKDPSTATVYVVDDDSATCEAIAMTMETTMLRTTSAQEPIVALSELAGTRYDLIFLDVNLPNMDGFELCQHIRQLPHHSRTPIVFLTGLTSIENQVQSSLSGGNDFVGKPFNLHELSVKALTLILRGSLDSD